MCALAARRCVSLTTMASRHWSPLDVGTLAAAPFTMPPEAVAAILERLGSYWHLTMTRKLEANPTSAEAERFAGFAAAGVNRLDWGSR